MTRLWSLAANTDFIELPPKKPKNGWETLSCNFFGAPVDVRLVDCTKAPNNIATERLKDMMKARPQPVKDGCLLWKMVAHNENVSQHHGKDKGGHFKSITLVYFGIAVCDLLTCREENNNAWWYLAAIVRAFRIFNFQAHDLHISPEGDAYFADAYSCPRSSSQANHHNRKAGVFFFDNNNGNPPTT